MHTNIYTDGSIVYTNNSAVGNTGQERERLGDTAL